MGRGGDSAAERMLRVGSPVDACEPRGSKVCRQRQRRRLSMRPLGLLSPLALPFLSAGACAQVAEAAVKVHHPEEYVNVLAGSHGGEKVGQHHSNGNTLPLIARPWGFNHWAPMSTNDRTSWWFDADSDMFRGIRCTHQPSPWIGDYGWFVLRPFMGHPGDDWLGFTSYHQEGAVRPYQLDLQLGPAGVKVEFTPSMHGGIMRTTFPSSVPKEKRKVCVWIPAGRLNADIDEKWAKSAGRSTGRCQAEGGAIHLESRKFSGGVPQGADFALYARFEAGNLQAKEETLGDSCFLADTAYKPLDMPGQSRSQEVSAAACQARCAKVPGCAHFTWWPDGGCHVQDRKAKEEKTGSLTAGPPSCPADHGSRQCCFMLGDELQAEIRIGTSMISASQALSALDSEVGRLQTYEDLLSSSRAAWRQHLSYVEVADAGTLTATTFRRLTVFYTCLYRALLFPRRLDEDTPNGRRHYSPYDGKVHDGPGVTDNGFWDTFRTVYPLLSLAYPVQLGEILEGWLNAYRAGGWLPKWASPGYRDSMVGTFADVVFADAILKNISGFDHEVAWMAIRKDAYESSSDKKDTARGKFGLQHYVDRGYVPIDVGIGEACSRTLDFAYADAASAQAGLLLGYPDDAKALRERSLRALNSMFDKREHLMGHRKKDGSFKEEPPEQWGDCYTEGSAWHHSFPPFNISALVQLHGGQDALLQRLRQLLAAPGVFKPGSYRSEIHEMREMRQLALGQYAHNNQPSHHLPYIFSMLGDQNETAALVRSVLHRAYSPDSFIGDEDNGEMGAWFVLGSLGLYAASPGTTEDYVLGAVPLFPRVHLRALDLTIEASGSEKETPAVREVLWRGVPMKHPAVPYRELRAGGTLRFVACGAKATWKSPVPGMEFEKAVAGRPGHGFVANSVSAVRGALRGAVRKGVRGVRQARDKAVQKVHGITPPPPAAAEAAASGEVIHAAAAAEPPKGDSEVTVTTPPAAALAAQVDALLEPPEPSIPLSDLVGLGLLAATAWACSKLCKRRSDSDCKQH